MEPTWGSRDLPVLNAIVQHFDEHGPDIATVKHFAEVTGLEAKEVYRAVMALSPTYLELSITMGGEEGAAVQGVTDEARRAVGQWPSPDVWADRIVKAYQQAAEQEPDENKRGRLRATAEALGGFGRDLLVEVLATGISKGTGMS
jgi:hypothetical protein